jgi:hypothetical protein
MSRKSAERSSGERCLNRYDTDNARVDDGDKHRTAGIRRNAQIERYWRQLVAASSVNPIHSAR